MILDDKLVKLLFEDNITIYLHSDKQLTPEDIVKGLEQYMQKNEPVRKLRNRI